MRVTDAFEDLDTGRLEDRLGYRFRERGLLAEALTHASTQDGHNERLEFLGDAVLNLVVAEMLYAERPEAREGHLTELKSMLVSRTTLERVAERIGLDGAVRTGGSLENRPSVPRSVLGNALEAILGAIYLDSRGQHGIGQAGLVALRLLAPERARLSLDYDRAHAKQILQHYAQRSLGTLPGYAVLEHFEHAETSAFLVAAELEGKSYPPAWGTTKREAERWAAWEAVLRLRAEGKLAG